MLVPTTSVSFLIGKSGATVSEIQHASGGKIQIEKEQEMLPGLGGAYDACASASLLHHLSFAVRELGLTMWERCIRPGRAVNVTGPPRARLLGQYLVRWVAFTCT
jgi:hypothetical protein